MPEFLGRIRARRARMNAMRAVPASLRTWFLVHFVADWVTGIPLLLTPQWTLGVLGFSGEHILAARLVGAALLGIGGASLLMRRGSEETFRAMLDLKVIWSLSAIVAILLSIRDGAPPAAWGILAVFVVFSSAWCWHRFAISRS